MQYARLSLLTSFLIFLSIIDFHSKPNNEDELSDVIDWSGTITLEESSDVIIVWPNVSIDSKGGFIVTDPQEHQIRLYDQSGKIKTYFGRQGEGPGEFSLPSSSLRLPSGDLLVADTGAYRTFFRFNSNGEYLSQNSRIFAGLIDMHILPAEQDEVIVVGTKEGREPGSHPLLHRFDIKTEEIIESFFPHPIPLGSFGNILFGQGQIATADILDDQIAAAFNPLPKIYFFDLFGTPIDTLELPLQHFRQLEDPETNRLSSREINDYTLKWSKVSDLFWIDNNILLVQYYDVLDRDPWTTQWNLAAVTRDGEILFEVPDTPRLFAVDHDSGELYFSHPDHDFENYWKVGKLSNHIFE